MTLTTHLMLDFQKEKKKVKVNKKQHRFAILIAARNEKYVIGNLMNLPFLDESFDFMLNCFALLDEKEFNRVLENEEILLGESVLAMLYVSGLEDALIYGFEGLLNYDETILELVGVSLYTDSTDSENLGYFNLANNKFAYVLPNGFNNKDEALITFEQKRALSADENN
mgnify:CR=1 FL=1